VNDSLADILEGEVERLATGFVFTEGPVWHPDGYFYFVDIRRQEWHRIRPGEAPELVKTDTHGSNGTTFDLEGRFVICESENRRLIRIGAGGEVEVLADRYEGKRFNRPNDVICRSDGSLYFTDPVSQRVALADRELAFAGIYRLTAAGELSLLAEVEFPNGLALSPDEQMLYVANTRTTPYILAFALDAEGKVRSRRIFADMCVEEWDGVGVPDGMKVDAEGRVYCTGAGGTWVFAPDGERIGVIETPEVPANLAFGGPDLRTLFITARTSVYAVRTKVAGQPHPWYAKA
jgi:gluconolactonase